MPAPNPLLPFGVAAGLARLALRLSAAHTTPSPARAKPDGSLVTACDQAIERNLAEEILKRFPSSAFRAEEKQAHGAADADLLWTIDPIDGTTNFVAGLGHWATVVAVERARRVEFGCVAMPRDGLCLFAARGVGAFSLDAGEPRPLPVREPRTPLFVSSPYTSRPLRAPRGLKQRCLGSMAGDLALVAAGRITGAFSEAWVVWDILGVVFVLESAGYEMVRPNGDPVTADSIASGLTPEGAAFYTGPPGLARQWAGQGTGDR